MWRRLLSVRSYLSSRLWIRPAAASLVSLVVAGLGVLAGRLIGVEPPIDLSHDALKSLLTVLASSMLAVATFSVAAVVTAVSSVATTTTPRASRLVLDDSTTQTVLASFIAAFIYSMIGIIAIEVIQFTAMGRLVIFGGFVIIVAWVLTTFLHWVDHVTKLGQVGTTIDRISESVLCASAPEFVGVYGARELTEDAPSSASAVPAYKVGYVTHLNVESLNEIAEEHACEILLRVRPGDFVDTQSAIAHIVDAPAGDGRAAIVEAIKQNVVIGWSRDHKEDFRFGLINLAETADRALSPAVNDPGTAFVILGRQLEALIQWHASRVEAGANAPRYLRIAIPPLTASDVISDCFTAISRDGAGAIEVGVRLQKTLQSLVKIGAADLTAAALAMSKTAAELADDALVADVHRARIRTEAARVAELAATPSARRGQEPGAAQP
jgi:uncharacterized membrane protein